MTSKQKVEADPDGITALLRGIKRGLDFLAGNQERVAATVIKQNRFGDAAVVRQVIGHFSSQYSITIGRDDIDSLISATRIEAEAKKLGGPDKFFTRQFVSKVVEQGK